MMWYLDDLTFLRIAFALVLGFFTYIMLDRAKVFKGSYAILIGLFIGLLSFYYTPDDYLSLVSGIYGFMGMVALAGLTFIIFFMVVHSSESSGLRRALWIFYGAVVLGVFYTSQVDVPGEVVIGFIIALLFVIIFDGLLHKMLERRHMNSWLRRRR